MTPSTSTTKDRFTLLASPSTDIWRKPPSTDVQSAPLRSLLPTSTPTVPLPSFSLATITLSADWTERYDQGGLYLEITSGDDDQEADAGKSKWLKTGIEFYQGEPYISTVGTDRWSDWSIFPLSALGAGLKGVTLEVKREGDELGKSCWCYALLLDESGKEVKRVPLREINWFFASEQNESVSIAAYAARPASNTKEALRQEHASLKAKTATVVVGRLQAKAGTLKKLKSIVWQRTTCESILRHPSIPCLV